MPEFAASPFRPEFPGIDVAVTGAKVNAPATAEPEPNP